MSDEAPRDPPDDESPSFGLLLVLWALMLAALVFASLSNKESDVQTVSYSDIKQMVQRGEIRQALLEEHRITVSGEDDLSTETPQYRAVIPSQTDPELLPLLEAQGVEVSAKEPVGVSPLSYFLPWVLILVIFFWIQRRMMAQIGGGFGAGGGVGGLFSGRFASPSQSETRTTFADVAGQDQAKKEVAELVEFLRDPERFERVGAEVPHGVLLMGPPGTGKTLLAKALAGEADVPFFSTSGSEFIEVFVGVGASRVRKMFEAARKAAPAVIFIDELDSIGRTRGTGLGGGHDEREQTLNQILAELDGFEAKEAVVVLAATNRPDVLDSALLRPGRFDRHVMLNLPDRRARRAILDIHARALPLVDPADMDTIADGTPGFSGADLKNLLNEAAIQAARRSAASITEADLQEARDKVMMGTVRTLAIQPEERHRLAVHEAGHTAAAYYTPGADPLYKVTIIPRGRSLGGTHMLEREEHHTLPEDYLRSQLTILLAGRAAEKHLIGSASSGADDDIKRATALARSMVARWGMSDDIGPVDLRQREDHPFLGQTIAQPREHANETAARVDEAVIALLKGAEAEATRILTRHEKQVHALIDALEEKEVLDFDEIKTCLTSVASVVTSLPRKTDDTGSVT
jgi:cell division protease FtsH